MTEEGSLYEIGTGLRGRWSFRVRVVLGIVIGILIVVRLQPLTPEWDKRVGFVTVLLLMPVLVLGALSRPGRIIFHADRVIFRHMHWLKPTVAISRADLTGYSDAWARHVRLIRKGEIRPYSLPAIPTRNEDERTQVLAALDRMGLPRVNE